MNTAFKFAAHNKKQIAAKTENKKKLLLAIHDNPTATFTELAQMIGVTPRSITKWRGDDPQYDQEVAALRAALGGIHEKANSRGVSVTNTVTETFVDFRKKYFGFDTPWFQADIAKRFETSEPGSITVVLMPPEHGKGLTSSTLLPTPDNIGCMEASTPRGFVQVRALRPGMRVYGRDGNPAEVLGVYDRGFLDTYRVTFSDGIHLDVDGEHLWHVRDKNRDVSRSPRRKWEGVLDTETMRTSVRCSDGRPRYAIPINEPVLGTQMIDPIVDPWLLGYWLGNGSRSTSILTTHPEDQSYVESRLDAIGENYTNPKVGTDKAPTVSVSGLITRLKILGLSPSKHIPYAYMWAGIEQRWSLLAGLLDSDGYSGASKGRVELSFTDEKLARDSMQLIRSLGVKVTLSESDAAYRLDGVRKVTGTRYRMTWTMTEQMFESPRKRAMTRFVPPQGDRLRWRQIESIEPIGTHHIFCIKVDAPDSLFLAGPEFIVTHNTTLTEDHLTYEISRNPAALITIVSEGEKMARKMSRRIQRRLEPDGSSQDMVLRYGPYRSPSGARSGQPWSTDAWTVHKGMDEDSRDFTVAVGGWKSNIAGTRATRLHVDDMQSLKSLNSTEQMIDIFRQDMLSRPGETGRTTINGTRVGENDIYERMNDLFGGEDFFRLIKYPAIVMNQMTGEPEPLWKELYSMEKLDRMRKKVGEEAWFRNYMQNPRTASIKFFTDDGIERCKNRMRRFGMNRQEMNLEHNECWLTLDPSIGGKNVVMAMHFGSEKLVVLDIQEDTDLARNSAIAQKVQDVAERMLSIGMKPVTLVIESMAFQKGLMEDEAFIDLSRKYGLRLESHETGRNKYDEDIGMASLASSVENGQIDLPWGDEKSEFVSEQLVAQFRAWKPIRDRITGAIKFQRGNRLRQDQLMALWFGWIWWTSLRADHGNTSTESFRMGGLPFTPTNSGLLVPR